MIYFVQSSYNSFPFQGEPYVQTIQKFPFGFFCKLLTFPFQFSATMPKGPFGEILGTTGTLDALPPEVRNYDTKVVQPRNPKLLREDEGTVKVKTRDLELLYMKFYFFQSLSFLDNCHTN